MFGQKKGWYTRIPGHYETFNVTHPVAYVGKSNHGTYHDDGGTGTCCYYEDFRNPGEVLQKVFGEEIHCNNKLFVLHYEKMFARIFKVNRLKKLKRYYT